MNWVIDINFVLYTESVFGEIPNRYDIIFDILNKNNDIRTVCIIGCGDGKLAVPLSVLGYNISAFDISTELLYGNSDKQVIEKFSIIGLEKRLKIQGTLENVKILNRDFFLEKNPTKYDFVIVCGALHYENNANLPMKEKIDLLKSSVADNGYIYINYMLSEKASALFVKNNEMIHFFNLWGEIIQHIESQNDIKDGPHFGCDYYHFHRPGTIFIRKTQKDICSNVRNI